MRILLISQWWFPEPESSRGAPFARWLQDRGHDVKVLTGFPNYPTGRVYDGYKVRLRQWDSTRGVPVLRVPLYPNHDRSAFRRIVNYLSFAASTSLIGMPAVGDVDVVYVLATPPTAGIPALLNKVFRGVPFLFNISDIYPEAVTESGMIADGWKKRMAASFVDSLCRVVYGSASEITTISKGYRDMSIARGLPAERIHAVYNWVDETLYRPVPRNEALAAHLGMTGKFNFLYGGNFGTMQGVDMLIRAAAELQDLPDVQFVLVGTGQLDAEVRRLAEEIGATNVRFTGQFDQTLMPEIFALADVLMMHLNESEYLRATVPGKTQVYLACGKPIVIATRGESANIIAESGAGIVAPPREPHAIAEALWAMYARSPEERAEMGRRARQAYVEQMALEYGAAQIEEILLRVAARRRDG